MNSKLLYAATLAVSVISTLAMADGAPLTRDEVGADSRQALVETTLRRTDCDDEASLAQGAEQHAAANRLADRFARKVPNGA